MSRDDSVTPAKQIKSLEAKNRKEMGRDQNKTRN